MAGLADQPRQPHTSPAQTSDAVERWVLAVRGEHPVWGGRKIRRVPQNQGQPEAPAPIEYEPTDVVRKVQQKGEISNCNREVRVGKAFRGQPVASRAGEEEGVWEVYFCQQRIGCVDLKAASPRRAVGRCP